MQCDLDELADLRRAWESLRPLWHPTSAVTHAFEETLKEGAQLGERAHVEATLSELKSMRATRGLPPAVNRTRAATLASKSGVLQSCWGAVVEACKMQGGGTLGGVVQRLSALSGSLHARHTELILLLLEEVLEREREKQRLGGVGGQGGGGSRAEVGVETEGPPQTTSSASSPLRSPLPPPTHPSTSTTTSTPARKPPSHILSPLHHPPPTVTVPSTPSSSSSSSSTTQHLVLPPLAPSNRLMTLRGLHDFLTALYASKERADATCRDTRQPLETLEQHLYTHLRHTVGLKVLIASQAKAFLSAVETFGNSDVDALIAHKVLQNDVNEGFIRDAAALRGECSEALRRVMREGVVPPGGGSEAVAGEMAARVGPRASTPLMPVPEVEWRGVLEHLAARFPSPEDKEGAVGVLLGVVKRGAAAWALGLGDGTALLHQQQEGGLGSALDSAVAGLSEEESSVLVQKCNPTKAILWPTLVSALVHMALARQERFLGGFVRVWRGGDEERRGWLHVSDFVKAVEVGAPDAAPSARSLAGQFLDRGVHTVTFSQAVECMAEIAEVEEKVRESRQGSGAATRAAADAAASAASFASLQASHAMAAREEEMRSLYARVLLAEAAATAPPPPPPLPPTAMPTSALAKPFLISPPPQRAPPLPPTSTASIYRPPPPPPPSPPLPTTTTSTTTTSGSGGASFSMTATNQLASYPTTKQRSRRSSLVMPSLHQLSHAAGGSGDSGGGRGPPPLLPQTSAPSRQHFTSMIIPGKGAKVLY